MLKKDPYRKRKLAALFILVLFVGSSLAIAVVDRLSFGTNTKDQKIPDKITYGEMSFNDKNFLLNAGALIVTYQYPEGCANCTETISALSAFVADKPDAFLIVTQGSSESVQMSTLEKTEEMDPSDINKQLDAYCAISYISIRYDACLSKKI